jgi:TrmH family RNA methyltransferase
VQSPYLDYPRATSPFARQWRAAATAKAIGADAGISMTMSAICIVLVQPRNPLNIGAAARAMSNFGFTDLRLVQPYSEAWRQVESARAGIAVIERARVYDRLADAIADRQTIIGTTAGTNRTPEIELAPWPEAVARWLAPVPNTSSALLFGSEKSGLSVEDISHCTALARLPTVGDSPSMNLGQAVAICCYELALRRAQPTAKPRFKPSASQHAEPRAGALAGIESGPDAGEDTRISPASFAERERLVETFIPLLEKIGVFRTQHRCSQTRRLREMLLRWGLTPADVRLLLGVARELRRVLKTERP